MQPNWNLRKLFKFIKDFVTNRTFQVRIENTLSTNRIQKNGTPQGSVISSILFLIMINDLTPNSTDIELSLFADDSAAYTSGKNINKIYKSMQETSNKITNWCDTWGFKLSPSKSKCLIFTKNKKFRRIQNTLKLYDKNIAYDKTIKFLGIILDINLNFNEHIEYINQRCQKRLNLLKNLRGTHWGANLKTLLTIYKTLIKPVIDYGCIIYYNTSKQNLNKLDSIQYQCLKLATSAMTGAPLIALQNETGELPLHLNRLKQKLIYSAKLKSVTYHRSKSVINYPDNIQYFNKPGLPLMAMETEPIFKQQNWNIHTSIVQPKSPWTSNKLTTKDSLINTLKTTHSVQQKLKSTKTLIETYKTI